MPVYSVYKVPKFNKLIAKLLSNQETAELEKFIEELKKGKLSGKRLSYDFFREKKIGGKRIYFLIYYDICIILLVAASNKKIQQETIDYIKKSFPQFRKIAEKLNT